MFENLARPRCPDMYDKALHAPALTPMTYGKRMPLSIKLSRTPIVKMPRMPPPSSMRPEFSVMSIVLLFMVANLTNIPDRQCLLLVFYASPVFCFRSPVKVSAKGTLPASRRIFASNCVSCISLRSADSFAACRSAKALRALPSLSRQR